MIRPRAKISLLDKGDRPENSVPNGDLLLAESVLQVVVVGVTPPKRELPTEHKLTKHGVSTSYNECLSFFL